MFWDKPPTSIEKFAIKKHMHDEGKAPQDLVSMRNTEYQELKNSVWAKERIQQKPKSLLRINDENELSDYKQCQRNIKMSSMSRNSKIQMQPKTINMNVNFNATTTVSSMAKGYFP